SSASTRHDRAIVVGLDSGWRSRNGPWRYMADRSWSTSAQTAVPNSASCCRSQGPPPRLTIRRQPGYAFEGSPERLCIQQRRSPSSGRRRPRPRVITEASMRWITRENIKVDRVACPWLIKRFIDAEAEFLFVPEAELLATAERERATPFDATRVSEVRLNH